MRFTGLQAICAIDIRRRDVAAQVLALHRQAYAQEARLAGVDALPPMLRGIADLQALPEAFDAVFIADALAAAISVDAREQANRIEICSLAVGPAFQRQGLGRALLTRVIARAGRRPVVVATAAANRPALALYRSEGFVDVRRSVVQASKLEIVHLHRQPAA